MGKDLEGICHSLMKLLSPNFLRGAEVNQKGIPVMITRVLTEI
jgi:hypothetical protein